MHYIWQVLLIQRLNNMPLMIISHTFLSTIRAVIGTPGMSIASNSMSASECY